MVGNARDDPLVQQPLALAYARETVLTRVSTTLVSLLVLLATIGLYLWNTTPPGVATVDISAPAEFNEFTPSMVLSSASSPASSSKLVTLLLAGTDSRDGLDKNLYGPFSGDRPDSIVLILTIPGTKTVLVSIPRDLIVTDVCTGEKMRINATFTACRSWSGPGRFAATVSRNTGLPVDHFAAINMPGFISAVDPVGWLRGDY